MPTEVAYITKEYQMQVILTRINGLTYSPRYGLSRKRKRVQSTNLQTRAPITAAALFWL